MPHHFFWLLIFLLGIIGATISLFFVDSFLPWLDYQKYVKKVQKLAQQAENYAQELNNLTPNFTPPTSDNIIPVLESTCLLLERLVDAKNSEPPAPKASYSQSKTSFSAPTPSKTVESEPQLSLTAKELIKLRDWVLLAQSGGNKLDPKIVQEIYNKLGKVLEKEKVISLEETGKFDYERQQVVDTQITNDHSKNDLICSTVRPGYLFNNCLIRPQEVIVYTVK